MRKTIWDQYRNKLRIADEAVKVVKSGDWVYYSHFVMTPVTLDSALAKRVGDRQISGSGGQGDFVAGAAKSKGGKAFICLKSTRRVGDQVVSRIVPDLQGITSIPRAWAFYVVTEYGKVCLKALSTWGIAENLISIAHPKARLSAVWRLLFEFSSKFS